jgi:four helix bundle protein
MNEKAELLRQRVKLFAIRVLKFVRTLPSDPGTHAVACQLAKSGPSVSANYRASCRARSRAEFIAKLGTVLEEADETEHWLDLLHEGGLTQGPELDWLRNESGELRAIFKASVDTARRNRANPPISQSTNKS